MHFIRDEIVRILLPDRFRFWQYESNHISSVSPEYVRVKAPTIGEIYWVETLDQNCYGYVSSCDLRRLSALQQLAVTGVETR